MTARKDEKSGNYRFDPLFKDNGGQVSRSPWGDADVIGRLNWITPSRMQGVLSRIDASAVYDLSVDYFIGMPAWTGSGDPKFEIWMTHTPAGNVIDGLTGVPGPVHQQFSMSADSILMNTHCGTHIDTLTHMGYQGRFWNGIVAERDLGSRAWMRGGASEFPPIIARGVLLDVARALGTEALPAGHAITPRDLERASEFGEVTVEQGDVVLIRTGMMTKWPSAAYVQDMPGIGLAGARFLCDELGAMCVGTDTIAFEAVPSETPESFLPVHSYMLAEAGAQIIENLNLEELAQDRVFECAFFGGALRLRGSTGSPMRAFALPYGEEGV